MNTRRLPLQHFRARFSCTRANAYLVGVCLFGAGFTAACYIIAIFIITP